MKGVKWHYILMLVLAIVVSICVLVLWPEPSPPETMPSAGELIIPWDEAITHAGHVRVVEGEVVSAAFERDSLGMPTVLHIGLPYPDPDSFVVVIWSDRRYGFVKKFPPTPEAYLVDKTVRVRGLIDDSKGYPQIVLNDPADIWIVE